MGLDINKNRIVWLDVAKGLGMLAIIIGHMKTGVITEWLFTFHVPLFFFLSGVVFSNERDFRSFTKRKIRRILVPYFCLGIPTVICFAIGAYVMRDYIQTQFGYAVAVNSFNDVLKLFGQFLLQRRMWSFWFLTCLFCLNLLFYLCVHYIHKDLVLGIVSCMFAVIGLIYYRLGGEALIWNIDICFTAFPFMFGGYYFRKKYKTAEAYIQRPGRGTILMFLFLTLNMITGYLSIRLSGHMFEMYTANYGIPILSYISAFSGIGFIVILSHKISWRPLSYIGRNSMLFLAWTQVIMMPATSLILSCFQITTAAASEFGLVGIIGYKTLQVLLIVLLCAGCNEVLLRSKLKFMLGM